MAGTLAVETWAGTSERSADDGRTSALHQKALRAWVLILNEILLLDRLALASSDSGFQALKRKVQTGWLSVGKVMQVYRHACHRAEDVMEENEALGCADTSNCT